MTIHLGGVHSNLNIGEISLPPLPKGTDIKGENLKWNGVQAILEAVDIPAAIVPLTEEERIQMERFRIQKLFTAEFVELCVCNKFVEKIEKCKIVMGNLDHVAQSDDSQLVYQPPQARNHNLLTRKNKHWKL